MQSFTPLYSPIQFLKKNLFFPVYEPKEDFLVNKLRTLPMFHDKTYADENFGEDEEEFLVMPYVFCHF